MSSNPPAIVPDGTLRLTREDVLEFLEFNSLVSSAWFQARAARNAGGSQAVADNITLPPVNRGVVGPADDTQAAKGGGAGVTGGDEATPSVTTEDQGVSVLVENTNTASNRTKRPHPIPPASRYTRGNRRPRFVVIDSFMSTLDVAGDGPETITYAAPDVTLPPHAIMLQREYAKLIDPFGSLLRPFAGQ